MAGKELSNPSENRESFVLRLDFFDSETQDLIMYAYDFAKVAHRGVMRQGGVRYFEHPRQVSLILIDECGIEDPNIIAGALLHDVAEDTPAFGSYIDKKHFEWEIKVIDKITSIFNSQVADIVISVTKPPENLLDVLSEESSMKIYRKKLENASADSILVKMADRLHNLRTQGDTPLEKQKRKVIETRQHYFPLFETIKDVYPAQYLYLKNQIDLAIEKLNII